MILLGFAMKHSSDLSFDPVPHTPPPPAIRCVAPILLSGKMNTRIRATGPLENSQGKGMAHVYGGIDS